MEKDIYIKLEIELSKANQNCWTIKEILSLKSDDLKELNSLLIAEKEKFSNTMKEINRLHSVLSEYF